LELNMKKPASRNSHLPLNSTTLRGLGGLLANPLLNATVPKPGEYARELAAIEITDGPLPTLTEDSREAFFMDRLNDRDGACSKCGKAGTVLSADISMTSLFFLVEESGPRFFCPKCAPKRMTRHIHAISF
jgi:hypothetical protein